MTDSKGLVQVRRALISVSDKTGLGLLGQELQKLGVEIISTGGTADNLREVDVDVIDVSNYTGFPEMMGGRLKTLHPIVQGGILARRGIDEADMDEHGIKAIDMVVVNLYPFRETVARGASFDQCVEQIDIGGPTMLRAAAKNHASVAVVSDPGYYEAVCKELAVNDGALTLQTRLELAQAVFELTEDYDKSIGEFFGLRG